MLILDDLLIRPLFSVLELIHAIALDELYDVAELQDELKENRLLYELGERSQDEYERRKQEIETEIEIAEQVQRQIESKFEVKGR